MNRVRSLALIAVLGGILAVGAAFAQGPGADGGRRGTGRAGAFARDGGLALRGLDLTEAQQQQIRALMQQYREQNQAAATRLRAAREAQRKVAEALPVDEQAIRLTTQALADAQSEVAIAQAKLRSDIFALLTPDQQAQAAKLSAEREARRSRQRERQQQWQPRQRS